MLNNHLTLIANKVLLIDPNHQTKLRIGSPKMIETKLCRYFRLSKKLRRYKKEIAVEIKGEQRITLHEIPVRKDMQLLHLNLKCLDKCRIERYGIDTEL